MSRAATRVARTASRSRWLHASSRRSAISNFQMPAMSPTMEEGGISSWKLKEGDSFSAGDVLLEIETDKATIDVEAQEDGILGKILAPDGTKNIPVGKVIALLAEQGDDISHLEAPKEEAAPPKPAASEPAPPPKSAPPPAPAAPSAPAESRPHKEIEHSRPLFPSVLRLLQENDIPDLSKIQGTGVRGMLTKGDVLAYLGKASSPTGTYKEEQNPVDAPKKADAPPPPLDGPAIRRLIVGSMYQASLKKRAAAAPVLEADFDSIISDYLPPAPRTPPSTPPAAAPKTPKTGDFLAGIM
ncbi:single hybrid motif-containing protein [Dentipellis sp. KUC8613]|nr:single hybrid motif-containing protein [Dentipellis sp. KUC8613]